jgi:hypothetical protein
MDGGGRSGPGLPIVEDGGPLDAARASAEDASAPRDPRIEDASGINYADDAFALDGDISDAQPGVDQVGEDAPSSVSQQAPCNDAVPVCVEYYAYFSMCTGRDSVDLACQPGLIPDGSDQAAQIVSLCEVNLQRIQEACR